MKEVTLDQIKKLANDFVEKAKDWHFHILSPDCQFNISSKFVLILENITDQIAYINYSTVPFMNIGKELLKMLHGDQVVEDRKGGTSVEPSGQVKAIIEKAKKLNSKNKGWHHHLLFPGCIFNKHGDKWVIAFEDIAGGNMIESISNQEPTDDMRHIEPLFYAQGR
ncbi:hypothetical protein KC717_05425 [Candidatus Dojkabacteria bacterium]|uniref:Uncharacterized protein n=1 Tax=Candidatus Dojkabacteria bacterium TaxID=2099670 RepID=A0A955L9L9_9BACT|nr:hypothetical protein [Candidatus Dojkabacteria bacterium]